MWNLNGGTVIGIATSATLSLVGATYLRDIGITVVSVLFLVLMVFSTIIAAGTIVRFYRNQRRVERNEALNNARREWLEAHTRSRVFADQGT